MLHKRILNKDRDPLLYNNTDMILLQLGMGVKSDTIFYSIISLCNANYPLHKKFERASITKINLKIP